MITPVVVTKAVISLRARNRPIRHGIWMDNYKVRLALERKEDRVACFRGAPIRYERLLYVEFRMGSVHQAAGIEREADEWCKRNLFMAKYVAVWPDKGPRFVTCGSLWYGHANNIALKRRLQHLKFASSFHLYLKQRQRAVRIYLLKIGITHAIS